MAAALQDVKVAWVCGKQPGFTICHVKHLEEQQWRFVEASPSTVLTEQEEEQLALYCIKMVDMGFGFSQSDIMAG